MYKISHVDPSSGLVVHSELVHASESELWASATGPLCDTALAVFGQ
jgi:hypothetical protein